ncbi:MAG: hypothetical protein KA166_10515 [Saprospiraceae bacterium]|nr:hypothetical protein [Saprospiraceae bacterium]MBP8086648.1 hypothetical protein [Saprospiraceae bacterium]
MTSVITGDIINSRNLENPNIWMAGLKEVFETVGPEPETWDIYRGDSFQLEVKDPEMLFKMALLIKATIKSIKGIDVRMALGVGEKNYEAARITESNGEAFINSGEQFEKLKTEKLTLAFRSPWPELDKDMNVFFQLASIPMDQWKSKTAQLVKVVLTHPDKGQQEIADLLGIQQAAVSQGLKRANMHELLALEDLFRYKIKSIIQ